MIKGFGMVLLIMLGIFLIGLFGSTYEDNLLAFIPLGLLVFVLYKLEPSFKGDKDERA